MNEKPPFTSCMSRAQLIAALLWLPVHGLLLPFLAAIPLALGLVDEPTANLLVYAADLAFLLPVLGSFLRRDFDALCDRFLSVLFLVLGGWFLSRFGMALVSLLLSALSLEGTGGNNEELIDMAKSSFRQTFAMAVFLGPIVEELLFRGAIFGALRRKSRLLAYTVSAVAFALYHVWYFTLSDPAQLLYALQYLPPALVLAYVYERSDCIWTSVFLHMLTNAAAMLTVSML